MAASYPDIQVESFFPSFLSFFKFIPKIIRKVPYGRHEIKPVTGVSSVSSSVDLLEELENADEERDLPTMRLSPSFLPWF